MKRSLVLALLAVFAISSCQIKEENGFAPEGKVFTATMEAMADDAAIVDTKTSMDANGNILWKRGDMVSIFVGTTANSLFEVSDASDGKTAASLVEVDSPAAVVGDPISNNVALYPAGPASIAVSGSSYIISNVELPLVQEYAQESFGNGAFPMTAVTSSTRDYSLKFKNVLGGLKLQIKGTATIASISFKGNNNEIICGPADVTVAREGVPAIDLTGELYGADPGTVVLDCGSGVRLDANTATSFIIALPPMTMTGGFTVTVTDKRGLQMEIKTTRSQIITRSNLLKMPAVTYEVEEPEPEPAEAVDLSLPSGLKWASFNLGASAPEEFGDYYAWGETEPYYSSLDPLAWKDGKTGYNWASYKWGDGSNNALTKYCFNDSNGTRDNKYILEPADDAAAVNWGGSWRMPTQEEWKELMDNCDFTPTTLNGVEGYLVTPANAVTATDNSIFLPIAGYWRTTSPEYVTGYGNYWTSSIFRSDPLNAICVHFTSTYFPHYVSDNHRRFQGKSIRPVSDEGVRVSVTGIALEESSVNIVEGAIVYLSATVTPSNATQPAVIWSSSDKNVAVVGQTGRVRAVSAGTATITATTYDGGFTATCSVTVVPGSVDLGLPSGLKWASCNVGASAPEESGDYFAWGETAPYYTAGHSQDNPCSNWKDGKTGYNWESYGLMESSIALTKYNTIGANGDIDNKTVLDPADDAATVNLGSTWRMPTDAEWTELRTECTWTWTTQNGVNGYLVTSNNNDNSIFLPATGERGGTNLYLKGSEIGCYWSSSLATNYSLNALSAIFDSNSLLMDEHNRDIGLPVRPVSDEGVRVSVTGITLNKERLSIQEGTAEILTATVTPSNATQPAVIWSSSDASVATVDYTGLVNAIAEGSATITATTYDGGFTATCMVLVTDAHTGVDLGLTSGLKWADRNIGANVSWGYGDYFAWGEIEPYYSSLNPLTWKSGKSAGYDYASYRFADLSTQTFYKYTTTEALAYDVVDNKTVLDLEDDAARANWGGRWRMPTAAEWEELLNECTWTWTSREGVYGCLVVGPNNNSIFLPEASAYSDTTFYDDPPQGGYWSSSLKADAPYCAYYANFKQIQGIFGKTMDYELRFRGYTIRPVK